MCPVSAASLFLYYDVQISISSSYLSFQLQICVSNCLFPKHFHFDIQSVETLAPIFFLFLVIPSSQKEHYYPFHYKAIKQNVILHTFPFLTNNLVSPQVSYVLPFDNLSVFSLFSISSVSILSLNHYNIFPELLLLPPLCWPFFHICSFPVLSIPVIEEKRSSK